MRIVRHLGILSTALLAAGCADQTTRSSYGTYGYTEGPVLSQRYNQGAADRSLEANVREQLNRYGIWRQRRRTYRLVLATVRSH